jgi:hypothetical protein
MFCCFVAVVPADAVVLDRKLDKNCDTGLFELIYKQQQINDPPQLEVCLAVEGRRIKRVANRTT